MKVGLIADTHIPEAGKSLPAQIKDAFTGVELILHAGDLHVLAVLDWLETIAPVLAVRGNGDDFGYGRVRVPDDPRLKPSLVLTLGEFCVGVTHFIEYPERQWRSTEAAMQVEFGGPVDIIVLGGSHVALAEIYKDIMFVSPGSPTLPRNCFRLGTVAVLEINDGKATASILQLHSEQPPEVIVTCSKGRTSQVPRLT